MENYNIKSVMLTSIQMRRNRLITREAMESYCKGKEIRKVSVNDDLELLFEDIRLGKERESEHVFTYFMPKLNEEELELVERRDKSYLETFMSLKPDVREAEMKLSESDSKFVYGECHRRTWTIKNSSYNSSCLIL